MGQAFPFLLDGSTFTRCRVSAGLRDVLGMTEWRKEHPKATWAEIEAAVDERINQVRAHLIQDVVQMGESEEWSEIPQEERPRCVTCGKPLWARGVGFFPPG
jgi:hypothetical protein